MENGDPDDRAQQAIEITGKIEPLLKGRHPAVQGAVLAQLLAKWVNGFQGEDAQKEMLKMHVASVRRMVKALP